MRKKVIFFTGILLLCAAGWAFYLYHKPHTGVDNLRPDITIPADELYKQYSADEAAADKKFLNKIILVSGIADDVSRNDSACLILLKGGDEGGISCNIAMKVNEVLTIQKGKAVTLKGRCTGFLMDVALTDCVIEKGN